ncbi:ATP-binding response regulator [Silvibacterium acidisoli]|uniref:ATP-binding response regulator n=1 Tax=Acidobacteriaceae bacterium ZG23-2 TaxID=2883246 RepID=UPI00406CD598
MTFEPQTILLVDDRPASRYTIAHPLLRAGYKVVEASSGREALELANKLPAVILLDVRLPDIVGYEVCRRIKANPHTCRIPVLQLSAAFMNNESKVYAIESGADAYMTQPVDPGVLVATVKSLSRLHDAENQASLAARQWQATFDALNEGIALIGPKGIIDRCNRAMTEILGQSYGEIEGHPSSQLIRERLGVPAWPAGDSLTGETGVDGRYFRYSLDPILLDSSPIGSIFILSEITDQRRAEAALLSSERLAATGRMAHTIAHEINNPLEAITNLLYLLQHQTDDPEKTASYLATAQKELARVSRITRQILSFNRESSMPVPVSLSETIEDVLALNNRSIVDKALRLEKKWDETLHIEGFPAQLRQVFTNIIRNSIEASRNDGALHIRISKSTLTRDGGKEACRVTICDVGSGIRPQDLPRIFDAFFTTKDLKGSGVGLWLSSTIINEHGGRIQVRSSVRPGRSGTCISVILPCASVAKQAKQA